MGAPVLLKNATDSYVSEKYPSKNYSSLGKMYLADASAADTRYGYLYFGVPSGMVGTTLISAKLRLYSGDGFSGSVTAGVTRLAAKFTGSRVNWNNKPATTGSSVTVTKSNAPKGTLWEFNVTAMMQQVANGSPWYGFRLHATNSTAKWFHAAQHTTVSRRPVLELVWSDAPDTPELLVPDNGEVVSVAKPTLQWNFTDPSGDVTMAAYQLRLYSTEALANAGGTGDLLDTTVSASVPQSDLDDTAYAGLAADATVWWRVRVQDGAGLWSGWSDPASFQRKTKGTLTLNNPAAIGAEIARNFVHDPSSADGTAGPWGVYSSTNAGWGTVKSVLQDGTRTLRIHRNEGAYDFAQLFTDGSVTGKTTVDSWAAQGSSNAPVIDTTRHFFGGASVKFNQGSGTGNYIGSRAITVSATPTAGQLKESTAYRAYARMWIPAAKTVPTGLRMGGTGVVTAADTTTATRDQWVVVTHDFTTKLAADGAVLPQIRGGGDTQDVFLDAFWIEEVATALPANLGVTTTTGVTSRPAGTKVTLSAEVMAPVGSALTSARFIGRDNPSNDSQLIENGSVSAGSQVTNIPADGAWRRIFVTFTVPAGRNLTSAYVFTAQGQALGEHLHVRKVMINDGDLIDFFDGDSADTYAGQYEWSGTAYASPSVHYAQAFVSDPTPPFSWSFTGRTQRAYEVLLTTPDAPATYIWRSGIVTSTATSVTPPPGKITQSGKQYRLIVRIYDTLDRRALPDDPNYVEATRDFVLTQSNTVAPVTGFNGVIDTYRPELVMTWSRSTAPDTFVIYRDGVIFDEVFPSEVFTSGTSYRYVDGASIPRKNHTWSVAAKVNGVVSSNNPTVTGKIKPITTTLSELDNSRMVFFLNPNVAADRAEDSEIHYILGQAPPVLITQSLRGYEGKVSGILANNAIPNESAESQLAYLETFKQKPGAVLKLVWVDKVLRVVIRNVTDQPIARADGTVEYLASFEFFEVGF